MERTTQMHNHKAVFKGIENVGEMSLVNKEFIKTRLELIEILKNVKGYKV